MKTLTFKTNHMEAKLEKKRSNIVYLCKCSKNFSPKELHDWLCTICTPEQEEIIACHIPLLGSNMLIGYDEKDVFILDAENEEVIKISQKNGL